jgi:hypothetical protein
MKGKYTNLGLALGLAFILLWLANTGLLVRAAGATELHVCPSGCAYNTVQAAVDAADPGDVIKVAAGTYTGVHARAGVTQVLYISQTVTVRGGYTLANWNTADPVAHPTTLDAQGQGRVIFVSAVNVIPVIEGLRITGGDASGLGGDPWGDDAGGGIYVNVATPIVRYNFIYGNTAYRGGGLFTNSPITLAGNTFVTNTANSGGGLYLYSNEASMDANIVRNNVAFGDGGGMVLNQSDGVLANTVVADNQGGNRGSGIFVYSGSPRLLHTTLARNYGGDGAGLCVDDSGLTYSDVAITNTIVYSHAVGVRVLGHSTATLETTLWHATSVSITGNVLPAHDLTGDPAFAIDGYHLTETSAALDQGIDAGVTTDMDGQNRPHGAGFDLGADEYAIWHVFLPFVLRD